MALCSHWIRVAASCKAHASGLLRLLALSAQHQQDLLHCHVCSGSNHHTQAMRWPQWALHMLVKQSTAVQHDAIAGVHQEQTLSLLKLHAPSQQPATTLAVQQLLKRSHLLSSL
jgi:hypothetical protein